MLQGDVSQISSLSSNDRKSFVTLHAKRSLCLALMHIGSTHFGIFLLLGASYWLNTRLDSILLPIIEIVFCILIARQLRALENIVHFGSHLNVSRNRKWNDFVINASAAIPVFQWVQSYRLSHNRHHTQFASEKDPCRVRISRLSRHWLAGHVGSVVVALIFGMWSFYREIGINAKALFGSIGLHFAAYVFLLAVHIDFANASYIRIVVSFILILPIIRFMAELSEHDYQSGKGEALATFNNVSISARYLIHPKGDAYHLLHHLYPSIPWWNQRSAHRFLMRHDTRYRDLNHRQNLFLAYAGTLIRRDHD